MENQLRYLLMNVIAAWALGRAWRPVPSYLLLTPLALGMVWMCYTYLDRYLPAL